MLLYTLPNLGSSRLSHPRFPPPPPSPTPHTSRLPPPPTYALPNMFCLRSWLPLLFIPTNASPAFIFLFFVCTYFLNRPCVYCSFLLLILFLTSCNWSDRCFFDFASNWFQPRPGGSYIYLPVSSLWSEAATAGGAGGAGGALGEVKASGTATAEDLNTTISMVAAEMINTTAGAVVGAIAEQISRTRTEWTGLGVEWMRSLLGRREWRIDCLDLYIRL